MALSLKQLYKLYKKEQQDHLMQIARKLQHSRFVKVITLEELYQESLDCQNIPPATHHMQSGRRHGQHIRPDKIHSVFHIEMIPELRQKIGNFRR